jgi:hypothetical protein
MNKFDFVANNSVLPSIDRSKNIFIERVHVDKNGNFISSEPIKPTEKQIENFLKKGCVHDLNKDKLAYDEAGWMYDSRYCAICNQHIGFI